VTEARRESNRTFAGMVAPRRGKRINGAYVGPGAFELQAGAERAALLDFLAVHAAHTSELDARLHALATNTPELAPLVDEAPEQRGERERLMEELLRHAIEDGAWVEHDRELRSFGLRHARLGVRVEAWFDVARLVRELHSGWIFAAYPSEPTRALAALQAMTRWADGALAIITRAYVDAKDDERQRVMLESRMKSEFLANMSHELRTPLNAIMGFTELLHDGLAGEVDATQQEFLGDILASGRHLLRLVNEVLDLAKIEAGRVQLRPDDIDLPALVAEVRAVLATMASKKRVAIDVDIDPVVGALHLDPAKLKQVLYNYLSNALKFTHEGGRVVVRVRPVGSEHFCLEVEDTGIGIDEADLARLFIEFSQLEDGTRGHVGTGLGLALTRRLVEAQGGSVGVRSVRGSGSTFHAILPRRLPAVASPSQVDMVAVAADAPRLLVVQDDAHDRDRLVSTLGTAGFAIEIVTTGLEAIQRLGQRSVDAVAIDLLLPDMSALEVLRKIRSSKANRTTPVVLLTACETYISGLPLDDFLVKPLSSDKLVTALQSAGIGRGAAGAVLIVDTEPHALDASTAALTRAGLRTRAATSHAEAEAICESDWPRALIIDVSSGQSDGLALVARLAAHATERDLVLPAVVWTASALTDEHLRQLRTAAISLCAEAPPLADVIARTLQDRSV